MVSREIEFPDVPRALEAIERQETTGRTVDRLDPAPAPR